MTDAPRSEHPNESGVPDEPPRSAAGTPVGIAGSPSGADAARGAAQGAAGPVRLTAWVRGRVQGVGFRWFTRAEALRIGGLAGYVSNLGDGRVQVVAEGARADADALLEWLRRGDTPGQVAGVSELWGPVRGGYGGFVIR